MATDTDDLRDIFLDVADEETVTERQVEEPSRAPIEDAERAPGEGPSDPDMDGLADAVEGAEWDGDASMTAT